ncbi:MAG: hypothetical protein V1653_01205, partial [bacterium]
MGLKKKDLILILLLFGLFISFFGSLVFTDATFYHRDIIKYYYPTKFFATESVQNGELPFWDPYLFCGNPFLAILQQGLFYPFSLLCYLLPFHLGFKYFFLVQLFLGGLFFYLLMRKLEVDSACSLIAAGIYIFSGYMISMINLLTTLCAVIWAPLIFLLFAEAIRLRSYFFGVLVGLILGFQFFAGQPEVLYMTVLMLGLWWLFHVFRPDAPIESLEVGIPPSTSLRIPPKKESKVLIRIGLHFSRVWPAFKNTLPVFGLSLIVFLAVSLIQLVPFLELVKYSSRQAGVFFEDASYWSFHPLELVTLVIPSFSWNLMEISNWFRQYWLRSNFIGLWPLILVFLAWRSRQNYKKCLFFFILVAVSLIFSLGRYTPVYYFLYEYIPGFNLIRYPVK